jgi:Uma2 family endonuclease
MATEVGRTRRFTADEWDRIVDLGVFPADERLELIDGHVVVMAPASHRHAASISQLSQRLVLGVREQGHVWLHGPVRLATDSVPYPDIALVRRRSYRAGAPRPEDVLLIIEAAEESLPYDETIKANLYARTRVPEYWIVGVDREWVDVYRTPEGEGYRERRRAGRGETVAPAAFPDVIVRVDDVFA